jgi:hypothetical protein
MPISDAIYFADSRCPGFALSFFATADAVYYVLDVLKCVTSRGSIRWVLREDSGDMKTPSLRAISITPRLRI